MPIPDADRAFVDRDKIEDYRLNEAHPEDGSKAVWFSSLGYERVDWQLLADDLLTIARTCEDFATEQAT